MNGNRLFSCEELDLQQKPGLKGPGFLLRGRMKGIISETGVQMVSQNVNKLLLQAKALSHEERLQFLELLKLESPPVISTSDDEKLRAALAKKGIVMTIPPQPSPDELERFRSWRPIEMSGPSLSDELIRDRR